MAGVIVLDTSWVVALRDPRDAHHRRAVETSREIAEENAALHPVTLAECLVAPARLGVLKEAAAALRASFSVVDVDPDAPLRWARLRTTTELRLPDCIVLDTALHLGPRAVATFDDKLASRAVGRGLEVLGTTASVET
ncbi:MAG: type II toxin-antitoxin system VapC family toxin [Acidimicrobiia bacterium]|nr:type II toxin-antitoxin system VapC family toxin [Acidimicrobiia bacterium]